MQNSQINADAGHFDSAFCRPSFVLISEAEWRYLRKRYRMTHRELQIAGLACQGLSNEDIAKRLNITYATVTTHMRNIYRKTWVRSKIGMLLRFMEDANKFSASFATSTASV